MNRNDIFHSIDIERAYQDTRWSPTDPANTPYHWASYISAYATRSLTGDPTKDKTEAFKKDLVKVAALAVAALEKL